MSYVSGMIHQGLGGRALPWQCSWDIVHMMPSAAPECLKCYNMCLLQVKNTFLEFDEEDSDFHGWGVYV